MTFDINKINKLTCPFCSSSLTNLFNNEPTSTISNARLCSSCYKEPDHSVAYSIQFENDLPYIMIIAIDNYTITTFFPRKSHTGIVSKVSVIKEKQVKRYSYISQSNEQEIIKERIELIAVDGIFEADPTNPTETLKSLKMFELLK